MSATSIKYRDASTARGNPFIHRFTLFWLIGVILLDKNFAYIHLGPIYITEFLMVCMVFANIRRVQASDIFFVSMIIFYIVGGLAKGYEPFFVFKDIAWLYYLLFLRFFPRDFPKSYFNIVMQVCYLRIGIIFLYPVFRESPIEDLLNQKYRDGVVLLFVLAMFAATRRLNLIYTLFFAVVALFSEYKTLMIVCLVYPFLLPWKNILSKLYGAKFLGVFTFVMAIIFYQGFAKNILVFFVDSLNMAMSFLGINKHFAIGTALWRAEIWIKALSKLVTWQDIIFGEFPGHNFMDSKFLGIKSFLLSGGDSLGNVRTAHNIIVQMLMKSGVVGICIYGWYHFKQIYSFKNSSIRVIQFLAVVLALTADILEVLTSPTLVDNSNS